MTQYTVATILRDGQGQPIPQYLDTEDKTDSLQGTFKPLTKMQPVELAASNIPGGLPVNIQGANLAVESIVVEDVQSKTEVVTFHEGATAVSEGIPFLAGAFKTLTVEIYGSATARTVSFFAVSASGIKRPLQGINLQTLTFAASTTGTGEIWSFDITGLESVIVEISSISGGDLTVKGKAVA